MDTLNAVDHMDTLKPSLARMYLIKSGLQQGHSKDEHEIPQPIENNSRRCRDDSVDTK